MKQNVGRSKWVPYMPGAAVASDRTRDKRKELDSLHLGCTGR